MSVEPQNVRVAFGLPLPVAPPKSDNRTAYEISVARHYGGRIPSFAEIAAAESRAMRANNPNQNRWAPAHTYKEPPRPMVRKMTHNEMVAARSRATVLAVLINGMTTREVAKAASMTREAARGTLRRLLEQNVLYATTDKTKLRQRWYRSNT